MKLGDILAVVSSATGISAELVGSDKRSHDLVRARFLFCGLAGLYSHHSLAAIGRFLGNRDHTTIRNATRQCSAFVESDEQFAALYQRCLNSIQEMKMQHPDKTPEEPLTSYERRIAEILADACNRIEARLAELLERVPGAQ